MTVVPLISPHSQYFDNNGDPLSGGLIYFYAAGTSTPKDTFTDAGGLTANPNPVVLDSAGRAAIWGYGSYKVVVKTSAGATLYTDDNYTNFYAASANTFVDNAFTISDNGDVTKNIAFEASGITTGTTRTYSGPNANGTLVLEDNVGSLSNKTLVSPSILTPQYILANERTVTAATNTNIFNGTLGRRILISGSATIVSLDSVIAGNSSMELYYVRFDNVCTLTYNATSLILEGLANITTAAGDNMIVQCLGGGNARVLVYKKASGKSIGNAPIVAADLPAGSVVSSTFDEYASYTALTSTIPADNTQPLYASEGTTILVRAFAMSKSTNKLRITFMGFGGCSVAAKLVIYLSINGGDAIRTCSATCAAAADTEHFHFQYEYLPASTSSIQYRVLVGASTGNAFMNGSGSSQLFSGSAAATMLIQEIAV